MVQSLFPGAIVYGARVYLDPQAARNARAQRKAQTALGTESDQLYKTANVLSAAPAAVAASQLLCLPAQSALQAPRQGSECIQARIENGTFFIMPSLP